MSLSTERKKFDSFYGKSGFESRLCRFLFQNMKLKFWEKEKVDLGYGSKGIVLKTNTNGEERGLVSISFTENKQIEFREECDGWITLQESPENAVAILQEAISWIKENQKTP